MAGGDSANVAVIKRAYTAFNDEDYGKTEELLDPAAVFKPAPRTPFAGTYEGAEAVIGLLRDQQKMLGGLVTEPEEFFEDGDTVVAFVKSTISPKGSEAQLEIHVGHLWTLRDGKIVGWRGFPERDDAITAAGLS